MTGTQTVSCRGRLGGLCDGLNLILRNSRLERCIAPRILSVCILPGLRCVQPQSSSRPERSALLEIGIELAAYDHTKPIAIDPVLLYSTCLPFPTAAGNLYITGRAPHMALEQSFEVGQVTERSGLKRRT